MSKSILKLKWILQKTNLVKPLRAKILFSELRPKENSPGKIVQTQDKPIRISIIKRDLFLRKLRTNFIRSDQIGDLVPER